MSQILDPIPEKDRNHQAMCYVNATSHIQVARITNIVHWYFERVVFPGQHLVFEAPLHANLEIHTGMMASAILSDTIPCERLVVEQPVRSEFREDVDRSEGSNYSPKKGNRNITHIPQKLIKDLQLAEAEQPHLAAMSSFSLQDRVS